METIYNFSVKDIYLNDVSLEKHKNTVLLIVNVASCCGLTYQYKSLEDDIDHVQMYILPTE